MNRSLRSTNLFLAIASIFIVSVYACVDKDESSSFKKNEPEQAVTGQKKVFVDPITVDQLLGIGRFCSNRLNAMSEVFFESATSTQSHKGFDFFSKQFLTGDSLTPSVNGSFSDLLIKKNIWSVIYSDRKYRYDLCFYDTLNLSIGIAYVTFYDVYNKLVTSKATGFLVLFKSSKVPVFINLYAESYIYYKITSIILLDKKLLPDKHMRFGKIGGKPPAPQFISKFVYDNRLVYKKESVFDCRYVLPTYDGSTLFSDLIDPVYQANDFREIRATVGSVTKEYNDLLPWFWCGSTLYSSL